MKKTFQTTDYASFKRYEFNREVINELNIKAIMAEMKVYGFDEWNPIVVSKSGFVADGQHRLEAAKRLGIPVWVDQYDREFTAEDIKRMNKNRINWKIADFIHADIESPSSQLMYKFIKDCANFGISQTGAVRMAQAANHKDQNPSRSDLGLTKEEYKNATNLLNELLSLKQYIKIATSSHFVGAYLRAKNCENFKLETFIKRLQKVKFSAYTNMIDIISEIESVYNSAPRGLKISIDTKGLQARR